ncbi:hypothetical protein [Bacteroides pyogenes]|uniref:hypothetical protein n=1 Tax=Bacteroides pyogenes TaxID=310300 RepID=UPI001BA46DE7|nr:hypothetical protein [Bacteroides pyogenes]
MCRLISSSRATRRYGDGGISGVSGGFNLISVLMPTMPMEEYPACQAASTWGGESGRENRRHTKLRLRAAAHAVRGLMIELRVRNCFDFLHRGCPCRAL